MKKLVPNFLPVLFIIGLLSCSQNKATDVQQIVLGNSSMFDLQDKAISIKRSDIKCAEDGEYLPLITSQKGDTIPAQLNDLDGDQKWDELFFVVSLQAGSSETLELKWVDTLPEFVKHTSARFGKRSSATTPVQAAVSDVLMAHDLPKTLGYQPYQTDGPSWENDKVGFRHYFDGRNAKDLFGKKVAEISPETVGINAEGAVEDNYHVMEDWGRDVLAVGSSLGIGGYALQIGDDLVRLGVTVDDSVNNVEETSFNILAEGPVKSVLNYQYKNWDANGRTYSVEENTSIWPGMYGYQNSVKVSGIQGDEALMVGLVDINTENDITVLTENDKYVVLYTHDKQTYDKVWWLGLALILPKDLYIGYTKAPETGPITTTFLAKLKIEDEKPIDYYAVACWELSDERFIDPVYFQDYLIDLSNQLATEVTVEIK